MTLARYLRIALGCLAVFLLTYLFLHSRVGDSALHERVLTTLRDLRKDELSLSNNVFRARHGMMDNHDGLLAAHRRIGRSIEQLQKALAGLPGANSLEERLHSYRWHHFGREPTLQTFKSGIAVLGISLSYFPAAATTFVKSAGASRDPGLAALGRRFDSLLNALMLFGGTGDTQLHARISAEIEALRRDIGSAPAMDRKEPAALLKHAEVISTQTATVDRTLAALTEGAGVAGAESLLSAYQRHFRALETRAERYKLALFFLSIVLLGYSFHSVLQLARARRNLMLANETLERRVDERTAEIRKTNHDLKREIFERREAEQKIRRMAHEDALTGLPNRKEFHRRLATALARSRRSDRLVGVLLLDLDNFKMVNDTLGHPAGDALLRDVAKRLQKCLRTNDTIARLGGDEFGVIIDAPDDFQGITVAAERLLEALGRPFRLDGQEVRTGTSIGVTVHPHDKGDPDQLVRNADLALYRSKAAGRGTYHLYDDRMHDEIVERQRLENDLRGALERREFIIQYQPQFDLRRRRITGVEALIRWDHPDHGIVAPMRFIPAADGSRLIIPISKWLLGRVCAQLREWHERGLTELTVSVNLSALHFKQPTLVDDIEAAMEASAIPPGRLELEITESMVMERQDNTSDVLAQLKALGVSLAIDDFGTGYSSLSYLKQFPVDRLKIDGSFVRDCVVDANGAAISVAIISLAHSLDLKVIAEGVETREQQDFLHAHGCDAAQGFHIGRPLLASRIPAVVEGFEQDRRRSDEKRRARRRVTL